MMGGALVPIRHLLICMGLPLPRRAKSIVVTGTRETLFPQEFPLPAVNNGNIDTLRRLRDMWRASLPRPRCGAVWLHGLMLPRHVQDKNTSVLCTHGWTRADTFFFFVSFGLCFFSGRLVRCRPPTIPRCMLPASSVEGGGRLRSGRVSNNGVHGPWIVRWLAGGKKKNTPKPSPTNDDQQLAGIRSALLRFFSGFAVFFFSFHAPHPAPRPHRTHQ